MIDDILKQRIHEILTDPLLVRNTQKKLLLILRLLDCPSHKQLACDFIEHALWIPLLFNANYDFAYDLQMLRRMIAGQGDIEEINLRRGVFYRDLSDVEIHNRGYAPVDKMFSALHLAYSVCCQRELEAKGWIHRNNHQSDAFSVAFDVARAVRHTQPRMTKTSFSQSEKVTEFDWQLTHILKTVDFSWPLE